MVKRDSDEDYVPSSDEEPTQSLESVRKTRKKQKKKKLSRREKKLDWGKEDEDFVLQENFIEDDKDILMQEKNLNGWKKSKKRKPRKRKNPDNTTNREKPKPKIRKKQITEHYLGEMKISCPFCGCKKFKKESKAFCCHNGKKVAKKLEFLNKGTNGYGTELIGIYKENKFTKKCRKEIIFFVFQLNQLIHQNHMEEKDLLMLEHLQMLKSMEEHIM